MADERPRAPLGLKNLLLTFTMSVLKNGVTTETMVPYAAHYFTQLNESPDQAPDTVNSSREKAHVPPGYKELLLAFTGALIRDKTASENMVPYAAQYFTQLAQNSEQAPGSPHNEPASTPLVENAIRESEKSGKPEIKVLSSENEPYTASNNASSIKSTNDFAPLPDGVAARERDVEVDMSASQLNNLSNNKTSGADEEKTSAKQQSEEGANNSLQAPDSEPKQNASALDLSKEEAETDEATEQANAEKEALREILTQVYIIRGLTSEQVEQVLEALVPVRFGKGQVVLNEGDTEAKEFYIIESGKFECFKKNDEGGRNDKVQQLAATDSFGELALLNNQTRAATIIARTEAKCWALDRDNFELLIAPNTKEKRQLYIDTLEHVDFLLELGDYQKQLLCDALEAKQFEDGDEIIQQGDAADGMYFVESGFCRVYLRQNAAEPESEIDVVTRGGYFGELALITNNRRAATVRADGTVVCNFLDARAFQRLCAPCMEVIMRNVDKYQNQLNQLGLTRN